MTGGPETSYSTVYKLCCYTVHGLRTPKFTRPRSAKLRVDTPVVLIPVTSVATVCACVRLCVFVCLRAFRVSCCHPIYPAVPGRDYVSFTAGGKSTKYRRSPPPPARRLDALACANPLNFSVNCKVGFDFLKKSPSLRNTLDPSPFLQLFASKGIGLIPSDWFRDHFFVLRTRPGRSNDSGENIMIEWLLVAAFRMSGTIIQPDGVGMTNGS